ncbi:hypothetical protein [Actinomyces slackii]|nr:hypothetical protein [Actinomyces slackii]
MSDSPSLSAGPDPAPTPGMGIPIAPRGRRRDHMVAAAAGIALAPICLLLIGLAFSAHETGLVLRSALLLVVVVLLAAPAAVLFATRSSVGFLASGLTALTAQLIILMAPAHAASAPVAWAHGLISTGAVLLVAGLWCGASWGMRLARRGGQAQGRQAFRLTREDKEIGLTPAPPPSRRRDHLLSLPWLLAALAGTGILLPRAYYLAVSPGMQPGVRIYLAIAASLILLVAATASIGRSTLGARIAGPLLVVVALPALLGDGVPGSGMLGWLLPYGPGAVVVIASGLIVMVAGWGGHLARRQGRSAALAQLRAGQSRVSGPTGAGD